MPKAKDDELITQKEAAKLRGVTAQAINELVKRGRLNSVERFGLQLVYRSEVLSFEPKTHKAKTKKAATKKQSTKKGKGKGK